MPTVKSKKYLYKLLLLLTFGVITGFCIVSFYYNHSNTHLLFRDKTSYEGYELFARAITLVATDIDGALSLCSKSDKMGYECFIEIAKIVSEKDFNRGLEICQSISDSDWRGECYFTLAGTMAGENLSLASELCGKSETFKEVCYDFLGESAMLSIRDNSSVALVCDEVPINSKHLCFWGIGRAVGIRFAMDTNAVIYTCNKVSSEFRGDCFYGFGQYLGQNFYNNADTAASACNKIPLEFRDECFSGLGNLIGISFGGDIDSAVSACNNTPLEFKANCFSGLRFAIDQFWGEDTTSAISACNRIPVGYNHFCLSDLSFKAGYNGNVSLCEQFKKPYRIICIFGFGKKEGVTFSEKEAIKCSTLTETFKSWCYRGFGRGLGERFSDNVSLAVSICNSSSSGGYNFDCYSGIVDSIAYLFSEIDSFSVLDKCGRAGKFSSYCFERVGKKSVEVYNYNLSKSFNMCYEVNEHFRDSCFTGIGKGLGETFLTNSSFASMKCNKLPSPYNIHCHQGLEEIVKFYNGL